MKDSRISWATSNTLTVTNTTPVNGSTVDLQEGTPFDGITMNYCGTGLEFIVTGYTGTGTHSITLKHQVSNNGTDWVDAGVLETVTADGKYWATIMQRERYARIVATGAGTTIGATIKVYSEDRRGLLNRAG